MNHEYRNILNMVAFFVQNLLFTFGHETCYETAKISMTKDSEVPVLTLDSGQQNLILV